MLPVRSGCKLIYIPGTGGEEIALDDVDSALVGVAEDLRSYEWHYSVEAASLDAASRLARESAVSCWMRRGASETALSSFEADIEAGTPGTLVSGEWSQRAYVPKASLSRINPDGSVSADLTFVLLDGVWRRETLFHLPKGSGSDVENETLDYPHDYSYDFGTPSASGTYIDVPGLAPCDLRIRIYGYAVSPYVRIGGNVYQVSVVVHDGAILTIDSTRKSSMMGDSVTLRGKYGDVQDVFSKRLRGAEGSGTYIFERLGHGTQQVTWPQSFDVDIVAIERRGGLPWS